MPTPVGLVVKNGSKARSITSLRHARAGIGHRQHDILPVRELAAMLAGVTLVEIGVGGLDREPAALGHGVARVDREIDDGVFELVGIDRRLPQTAGQHGLDRDRLADGPPQQFRHVLHQPVDLDGLEFERVLAGIGQEPLHQRRGAVRRLAGGGQKPADAVVLLR